MGQTIRVHQESGGGGGTPTGPAGGDLTGTYPNPLIGPLRVTEDKIAANAVTTSKIAGQAVTNPKIAENAVDEDKIQGIDAGTDGQIVASDGAGGFKYLSSVSVDELQQIGDVPNYPVDDLRYKLVVEGGTVAWRNDQSVIFSLPFVKSQNLNAATILETHSSFGQPSCYTIGGDGLQAELIGFALVATSAAASAGSDLDVRFYEFTATGAPRAFNSGTLLFQTNNGEFPQPQSSFNYYGKDVLFDTPIVLTQGADQRLFCDVNPFANWSITDIEVRALVRLTLLPTP